MMKAPWFVSVLLTLIACHVREERARSVSPVEFAELMGTAAELAAKKLPRTCLSVHLRPNSLLRDAAAASGKWIAPSSANRFWHRQILTASNAQMPASALARFAKINPTGDCRHTLEFDVPDITEAKTGNGSSVEALVAFGDYCALCGAGYTIWLTKKADHWEIGPRGLERTWVS